jgi:hypothetical protein
VLIDSHYQGTCGNLNHGSTVALLHMKIIPCEIRHSENSTRPGVVATSNRSLETQITGAQTPSRQCILQRETTQRPGETIRPSSQAAAFVRRMLSHGPGGAGDRAGPAGENVGLTMGAGSLPGTALEKRGTFGTMSHDWRKLHERTFPVHTHFFKRQSLPT